MRLLIRWVVCAVAVAAAARLLPGIRLDGGAGELLAVALLLGLVNALVRPLLRWLSCGCIVATLGLFLLVINAALLLLVAHLAQAMGIGFFVEGFADALAGSVLISLVSFLISLLVPAPED